MPHMSPRIKAKKGRFGTGGLVPLVKITSPDSGFAVSFAGSPLGSPLEASFGATGTATDDKDGDISANLVWTSSLDGNVGTGASPTIVLSTAGVHTITATVTATTGSPGATASDTITVTVSA